MRDYIPKELYIDREAYKQVLSVVRRYDLMRKEMHENELDVIYSAPVFRGAGGVPRPTESKAILLDKRNAEFERQTRAVEQALVCFDDEERKIITDSIVCNAPLKRTGIRERDRTMGRRKQEFVHMVALNLHLV